MPGSSLDGALRPIRLVARRHDLRYRTARLFVAGMLMISAASVHVSALKAEEIAGPSYWGTAEESGDPAPSLLHDTSASFVWEGRAYHLNATDAAGTPARLILETAIAELAPGLALDCFHRLTSGSWDDLAAAGLGDPRAAVPAGFSPQEMRLLYYAAPSASCPTMDAGIFPTLFFASFVDGSGRRLELRTEWSESAAGAKPGWMSDLGAEWSQGSLAFSVAFDGWLKDVDEGTVAALAHALDPAFEKACQRRASELSGAQLSFHGLRAPTVPAGFQQASTRQTARLPPGGCSKGPDAGELDLAWVFTSANDIVLEVGAVRGTGDAALESVLLGADYVRWTDAQGTTYYVYGHALDEGTGLSQADLFAVARSLDPGVPLPD